MSATPAGCSPAETTARIPIGVEVERYEGEHGPVWSILRLRPGSRHLSDWTLLAKADGVSRFYAGTVRLVLHARDAGLYAARLSTRTPVLDVVFARTSAEPGWILESVSLLPEATAAPADGLCSSLPIPASLRTWIEDFSARHAGNDSCPAAAPEPTEPFLDRWARLKQCRRGPEPPAPVPKAAALPAPDLPPLASLRSRSDYAAYLRDGVPQALRLAALRQAWARDPAIAGHKPLVDYDWNFNAPGYGRLLPADDPTGLVEALFGHLRRAAEAIERETSSGKADISPEDGREDGRPETAQPAPHDPVAPGLPARSQGGATPA